MPRYEGPMIVALGLYLGVRESDGKAIWQTGPRKQLAYSGEIASHFELFSGAMSRKDLEGLTVGFKGGAASIDALIKQGLLLEVPDGVDAAMASLSGKALFPRASVVKIADGIDERGWPIHNVYVRPTDGDGDVVITFPFSRVLEDAERDLPDALRAVAAESGIPLEDLFARFMQQIGYAIGEQVVLLADVDADRD